MTLYTCYTLFFLFLLFKKNGTTRSFNVNETETKWILIGLVIYCASYLVSSALIKFGLKNDSFQILSHHALLLAISVVLFIKMIKTD